MAGVLAPITVQAHSSCTSFHGRVYLTGFTGGHEVGSSFYASVEDNPATATIASTPGDCEPGGAVATASYETQDGSATGGEDYEPRTGTTEQMCNDVHPGFCPAGIPTTRSVDVSIDGGDGPDARAVESLEFRLTGGANNGLLPPWAAPIHIIDAQGSPRGSLEPTVDGAGVVTYSRSESFDKILIPVFLAGTASSGSVGYTVEPDPAAPATPGDDFQVVSPNPLPVGPDRVGFIEIAIVNDTLAEAPESVVITLGGTVDGPPSTTFTILDNEEFEPPRSRLHHPRHKWRYKKSDFRIREVHVFTSDNPGGSGVVAAQFALKRTKKNGSCQWRTKGGWQAKDCQNRQWVEMKYDQGADLFYVRLKQLKSSVKTKIKNYTAFSRAIDGAGNVEKDFANKRNENTFEVKRTKKRRR
jgi:hypothetical protein